MSDGPMENTEKDRLLDRLVTAYLEAVDAGQRPDRGEWAARHPTVAAELEEFFADQDRMERAAVPLREVARVAQAGATPSKAETLDGGGPWGSPAASRAPPLGDYELLEEIGQGGSGVVYRARQVSLNRLVALKMILDGRLATQGERQRFRNEAEMVADMDHPSIVPIYEVGEHQGRHYFSMKLLSGGSLAEALSDGRWGAAGKEGTRRAARLVATVARAVHHAHQRGILHRDLKPGNVLLDDQGQPHVTDFGLAKRIGGDSGLTHSGAIVGTPSYMAPEQASANKGAVTTATDVYGLGAVLYAALAGRPPFQADTVLDTILQVKEQQPEPPGRLNRAVDRDLEVICLKCLQKDPRHRYGSAEALAEDLERWLKGEPIRARPVGPAVQVWRWCRRNPAVAALTAAVVVLLVGATAGLAASNVMIRREQGQTRAQHLRAEANFQKRLAAVDGYFTRVSESQQLKAHGLEKLRHDLLRDAREFYEQLVQEGSDDPGVQTERGRVHGKLTKILREMGETDQAIDHAEKGRAIFTELARAWPDEPNYRHQLGIILQDLASIHGERHQLTQAERLLTEALPFRERLVQVHSEVARYQENLGRVIHDLGLVYAQTARPAEARAALEKASLLFEAQGAVHREQKIFRFLAAVASYNLGRLHRAGRQLDRARASFEQSLALQKQLAKEDPDDPTYRSRVGAGLSELGHLHFQMGKPDLARKTYEEAVHANEELARDHPRVVGYQELCGRNYSDLGNLAKRAGKPDEARKNYEKALGVFRPLAGRDRKVGKYHDLVALVLGNLADLYQSTGKLDEAQTSLEEALAIREKLAGAHPEVPELQTQFHSVRLMLANLWARSGQHERATAEVEAVLKAAPAVPLIFYDATCAYSRASEAAAKDVRTPEADRQALAGRYASRGVELLGRAVDAGYDDVAHVKEDQDLDPLRGRTDFQGLLRRLEAKEKPRSP